MSPWQKIVASRTPTVLGLSPFGKDCPKLVQSQLIPSEFGPAPSFASGLSFNAGAASGVSGAVFSTL
ncbi:MAG: hypothetical protein WEB52_05330 [Dehalococcoidia bacterium]